MCDVTLAIVGAALAVGGTVASMEAQKSVQRERSRVLSEEMARQDKYAKQAGGIADQSIAEYENDNAKNKIASAEAQRLKEYDAILAEAEDPVVPGGGKSPQIVSREFGERLSAAKQFGRRQNDAKARLEGFNDFSLGQSLLNVRRMQDIDMIGSIARGSSNVVPLELEKANRAGNNLAAAGSLMSAFGSGMFSVGAAGGGSAMMGKNTIKTGSLNRAGNLKLDRNAQMTIPTNSLYG